MAAALAGFRESRRRENLARELRGAADIDQVRIRVERVQDGKVRVSVRDSGPGFPDGIADQFFEPFFTTKAEGTGMGLAIARSIVEAHGGTLSGENCAGGALFTICLPEAGGARSQAA